ncbi:MAG: hypothetical protein D3916_17005 [Candidatus Electrothrix sp. MAN1_4]|nr:hypothetical protein [Candidatus Electrothrix sp. MAN1_4]
MPVTIQQRIKAEDIFAVIRKYRIKPQQRITLSFETEVQKPPYKVPKEYPDEIRQLVERAKKQARKKQKKGYPREEAVKDFFKIQKEIS